MSARPENAIGAGAPACAEHTFYRDTLEHLRRHGVPFLVGGAYALAHYGGVQRATKDFDIFVRPADCGRTLAVLAALGLRTEVTFTHWLGKAFCGEYFIDVIFGSGNGLCRVDDEWFAHAIDLELWGVPVQIVPAEEMIWSKASIMERDRFDGADIAHVLRAHGPELDWGRLLARFGGHWRILLAHLVLYGFIYPSERERIPGAVLEELLERLRRDSATPPADDRLCRGTLLSILQYRTDVEEWGYRDARLPPEGTMSPEEIARWMAAFTASGPR
jgi:hypothetical protein